MALLTRSLAEVGSDKLLLEFDKKLNVKSPQGIASGSHIKVWWICSKIPRGHKWLASPNNRFGRGNGCPGCSNKVVTPTNNLAVKSPFLAKEWHPTKNKYLGLTPETVLSRSIAKFWWRCSSKACGWEWSARVQERFEKN